MTTPVATPIEATALINLITITLILLLIEAVVMMVKD